MWSAMQAAGSVMVWRPKEGIEAIEGVETKERVWNWMLTMVVAAFSPGHTSTKQNVSAESSLHGNALCFTV